MKGITLNVVGEISDEAKEKLNKLIINRNKKLETMKNSFKIKHKKKKQ